MPKFYVVLVGRSRGIYTTWNECKSQVDRFPGAKYASFKTREDAEAAYASNDLNRRHRQVGGRPLAPYIAVDASCLNNGGQDAVLEYRGVAIGISGDPLVIFSKGPFMGGTNNVGEFLAIVAGFRWMEERSLGWPVYSDSDVAIGWVAGPAKFCNTANRGGLPNDLKLEVLAAEQWLQKRHEPAIVVHKWDTESWGEIPADYGRK